MQKDGNKSNPAVTPIYPEKLLTSPIPPPGVKVDENVYVTMRDGVKIAVDVYLPEKEGRYPALLSMSPYMKEIQQEQPMWSHSIEAGATGFFVPKGYAHVIVQIRGCGLSQGQWNLLDYKEQEDGYDIVEWIAQQPWCDGNVGMIGDSYFGWSQYYTAAQQPPHLKCLCFMDATVDQYRDVFYPGGIYHAAEFADPWTVDTIFMAVWPGPVEGKLPPINLSAELAAHPYDGPWYWERSAWTVLDKIKVPVLSIAPQLNFLHWRGQLAAYPEIKAPKKLLVVPETLFWSHMRFLTNRPLNEQLLKWLDYWLKGIDTGIMDEPEVAIFDTATEEWRYENEYPLARTEWTKFYLRSNPAGPATEPPYGLISMDAPGSEEPDKYKIPDATNKLLAGELVLAYATPALDKDLKVWGPLSLTLYGSSTSLDTAWFARVMDIAPDGSVSKVLTRGILKASFREVDEAKSKPGQPFHPFQKMELLEPNKIYEFQIEIPPICHTFKAGHKIQLHIASYDLRYYSILHTIDMHLQPMPAENAIYHNSAHPSHLFLPVIPDAPIIKPVEPPVSQIKWPFISILGMIPDTTGWPLLDES